ncbi:MAG: AtpZ/AtpI family protein [Caulobacterales bacterium]
MPKALPFMSQPDDESRQALERLNQRLTAFKADGSPSAGGPGSAERGIGEGYRYLGEVIGGILGGLGLGWVVDHFAHTTPFGIVIGLLLGTAASAYAVVKTANAQARRSGAGKDGKED